MKIFIIILCFGFGIANAAVQIKSNPDKQSEIVLSTASGSTSYTWPPSPPMGDLPVFTTWSWQDGGGSYSYVSLVENGYPDSLWMGWEEYDSWNTNGTSSSQDWEDDYNVGIPPNRFLYSTDGFIFPGFPREIGSLSETTAYSESLSRNSKVTIQLKTGGKSGSKLKNLFGLQASATGYHHLQLDDGIPQPSSSYSISSTSIQVAGNFLNTNGNAYAIFPDNSTIDITPKTAEKYYSIDNISATKYHSHFTVFVDMPDPPPGRDINEGDDYGHVWWKFDTDTPDEAIRQYIQPFNRSFLGKEVGYYPVGDIIWYNLGATDGALKVPDPNSGNKTVTVPFDIGFSDLMNGLDYTGNLYTSPGTWDPLFHNCVHAAWFAGASAGIFMTSTSYPEIFGYEVQGLPY